MSEHKPRRVHVETVTRAYKGKVYKSVLLRRTYREDGKVKHETVGNLSDLTEDTIDYIKRRLAGDSPLIADADSFRIVRSLPHGNVAAVLGTAKNVGLDKLIVTRPCRELQLVMAMVIDRIISPGSKLGCSRGMQGETAQNTLAEELRLGDVDVHELYASMDWLLARQTRIENKLAKKHLTEGTLVLFDLSSSFSYGRKSDLVKHGYSRDHRSDRPQITYGLLCDPEGRPVAVEVLPGNTSDPKSFSRIVDRVRKRFGLKSVVFVGDRGMITSARINENLRDVEGLDWISALRTEGIRKLVDAGYVDRSLFDERDLAEVTAEELFPGERLVVCRNPILAEERGRKRAELLAATEEKLDVIVRATQRKKNPLNGEKEIGLRVGKVIGRFKMEKHFELTITADSFTYTRLIDKIAAEAALDGLYVVRTSVPPSKMGSEQVVETYKSLATVERAFRSMKTVDLHVRPIFHWNDDRIRAHVFLCMLAYYVEWHMRQRLQEVLYEDEDRESAKALRKSIVAPAVRSPSAKAKDATGSTASGLPVQSFQDLLKDLATLCRHRIQLTSGGEFQQLTESTTLQRHVLELLDVVA